MTTGLTENLPLIYPQIRTVIMPAFVLSTFQDTAKTFQYHFLRCITVLKGCFLCAHAVPLFFRKPLHINTFRTKSKHEKGAL